MFLNQSAAQSALIAALQTPAQPGWHWGIRKVPGMQMWFVGQFWNAASA